jgi:hypothetical protein
LRFQELSIANNPELVAARVILSFDMDGPISCKGVKCILVERKIRVIGEDEKAWQRERPKAEQLDKIAFDCVSRVTPVLPITRKGPTAFAVRPCTFWLPGTDLNRQPSD